MGVTTSTPGYGAPMVRALFRILPRLLGSSRFEMDVDPLLSDGGPSLLD